MRCLLPFIVLFLFSGINGSCQPTAGNLDVPRMTDATPIPILLARLDRMPPDSNKLDLLLSLSYYYWRTGKGGNLDTCLTLATQVYTLGVALHSADYPPEAVFIQAKVRAERNEMKEAGTLVPLVYGEQRARVLLVLAEQYINHKPVDIHYLDGALPYAQHALELADSIRSDRWRKECQLLLAKYYFEKGEMGRGKKSILAIIEGFRRAGDRKKEAHYWSELDLYMPKTDSTYPDHLEACRNTYELYVAAGAKEDALFALRDWGWMELWYEHLATAEQKFDSTMNMFRSLHKEPTPSTYLYLAELYLHKSDFPQVVSYAQKALPMLKPTDQRKLLAVYYFLGESSLRLGEPDDGLRYARLAMSLAIANKYEDAFYYPRLITEGLIRKDSTMAALQYLRKFTEAYPPGSAIQERTIDYCYAMAYDNLGQYSNAERYFLRVIHLGPTSDGELRHRFSIGMYLTSSEATIGVAKFYVRWGRCREALAFLLKAYNDPEMARQAEERRRVELLLFQVYLALGDPRLAMSHHTRYVALNDSIFNVEKMKQFQTLQVRYETRQKEQALLLLELRSQKEQAQLKETSLQRNVTLGGVVVLLLLSVLTGYAYRRKRRLVEEKDGLLKDKDLLMQEIHHRVKNNLNIIISLLESQSMYLNNPAAQAALQDTQNRIQAVFLLHQKLYRPSGGTVVDVTIYILELVDHLCESFDTQKHHISITHRLEPVFLDAFEVLPLGMILNEGITNAVKHAFPGNRMGHIELSLHRLPSGEVLLQIKDNGIGLPAGFSLDGQKSMGITLITGLVGQLHGSYSLEDKGGVEMTIRFNPKSPFSADPPPRGFSSPDLGVAEQQERRWPPGPSVGPG